MADRIGNATTKNSLQDKLPYYAPMKPKEIPPGIHERQVAEWPSNASRHDHIAQETPVALVYNGISHAVMMASPIQLEAFALGFSLSEGIVDQAADVFAIDVTSQRDGIEVALSISSRCFARLKDRRRHLTGRTGCGLCGAESLQQVRQPLAKVDTAFEISHAAINTATVNLGTHQPLQELTGSVHGAAWCNKQGHLIELCEDIGRHNALDKLIGLLWNNNFFQQPGFLLVSSRASYEMVQKAAKAKIAMIVAVSAPTSLAIDIAEEAGITLVGFSRPDRHVTYSHNQRLTT